MKRSVLLLILSISCSIPNLCAQVIMHEFGVRTGGLNNFGFMYKRAVGNAETYKRIRAGFTEMDFFTHYDYTTSSIGVGAAIGWEKRRTLANKFEFIHGFEPSFYYNRITGIQFFNENTGGYTVPYFGTNIGNTYFFLWNEYERSKIVYNQFGLGLGYILGLQYRILDNCYLGVELIPAIYVNYTKEKGVYYPMGHQDESYYGVRGSFNMSSLAIFFSYRFGSYKREK